MSSKRIDPGALRALAVSESGFVFDPRTGHSYTVNATGLAVLEALKEGLAAGAIAERLRAGFAAGGAPVEDDVDGFVALLHEHGLGLLPGSPPGSGGMPERAKPAEDGGKRRVNS
jgi:hypothetical protein